MRYTEKGLIENIRQIKKERYELLKETNKLSCSKEKNDKEIEKLEKIYWQKTEEEVILNKLLLTSRKWQLIQT